MASSSRGGRPRRGGSGHNINDRTVQISKKLSWLLRHGAETENLSLGPGGFANLADVLNNRKLRGLQITFEEVKGVVADNEKQRFTMVPVATSTSDLDGEGKEEGEAAGGVDFEPNKESKQSEVESTDPKDWKIRANQGHSLKIEEDGLLDLITPENIPATAVHGTTHAAWPSIVADGGLKTMGRNHVHFASGLPAGFATLPKFEPSHGNGADADRNGAENSNGGAAAQHAPVISGMRSTSTILIYLSVEKAMKAGLKFWRSANGVVLSEGNAEGLVPLQFFERVEDRTGEGVLVQDGVVVKEAPGGWGGKGKGGGGGRGRGKGHG
ncbi:tRNA 2'-phosphotransferase [Extremus antarcticus]|uniref:2'-phosphotransferase n=1 Tax=Extremus antarcticus TaxID=702011 RepID=A0AAJ0DK74_9PEZI|nr:tRNA 2'-phosphotransferase [Extremus antarcticus]